DSIVISRNSEDELADNFAANFNLRHVFDSTGKDITVDIDYVTYNESDKQLLISDYLSANESPARPSSYLKGHLPSKIDIYSAKTYFTLPFIDGGKLEAGIKISYVTTDNNANYQVNTTGNYETDLGKTNHFIYKENINAACV